MTPPAGPASATHDWPEAMATVTACKYQFGAGRALAFGIPARRHFLITFNYWAGGQLHTGQFTSATAVPQGSLFPVTYNPDQPLENNKSAAEPMARTPLLAVGILGSVVLSLAWFAFLHGCS